jgi:hypothetical protein
VNYNIWIYPTITIANFFYIFLKAWQQRNVAFMHYGWAAITNAFLVATEIFVMGNIAVTVVTKSPLEVLYLFIAMSIGGGSGCILSMYIHNKYIKHK